MCLCYVVEWVGLGVVDVVCYVVGWVGLGVVCGVGVYMWVFMCDMFVFCWWVGLCVGLGVVVWCWCVGVGMWGSVWVCVCEWGGRRCVMKCMGEWM